MTSLVFKKLVSRIFFPVPFCMELLLVGMLIVLISKRPSRRLLGKFLMVSGLLFLLLYASPPFADGLLRPLEHRFPVLTGDTLATQCPPTQPHALAGGVATNEVVVGVLGHWTIADDSRPGTHRLTTEFLSRLTEGVRVYRLAEAAGYRPQLQVMMTNEAISPAERSDVLGQVLRTMGLGSNGWHAVTGCVDTAWEIATLEELAAGRLLVVATSPSHLPRAMLLAKQRGLTMVPAPATPWTGTGGNYEWHCYIPCAEGLRTSERAVYEYIGLSVAHVKDWLTRPFNRAVAE